MMGCFDLRYIFVLLFISSSLALKEIRLDDFARRVGRDAMPGYVLLFLGSKQTWKKYPFHRKAARKAAELIESKPPLVSAADVEVFRLSLSHKHAVQAGRFLGTWLQLDVSVSNYTQVILVNRRSPFTPRHYMGLMTAEAIAQFTWRNMLPELVQAKSLEATNAFTQHLPCLVACLPEASPHLLEFEHVAAGRADELGAVLVTEAEACPFDGYPAVGVLAPSGEKEVLLERDFASFSVSDWLMNRQVPYLPELSADNNQVLEAGGWIVIAMFDLSDPALYDMTRSIMQPIMDKYKDKGYRMSFVTASVQLYGHQFGVQNTDHAIIMKNLDVDDHELDATISGFSKPSAKANLLKQLKLIAESARVDVSDKIAIAEGVINSSDAQSLRAAFETYGLSKEDLDADPDTVDGKPTFEVYLWPDKEDKSKNSLYLLSDRIVREKIMPHFRKVVSKWVSLGLLPDIPLKVCNSFIRRYKPMERRNLGRHKDSSSTVTVNVQLSESSDFEGGLAVYPEATDGYKLGPVAFPESGLGSVVLHRSDLYHGVRVTRGERFSWILWFRPECTDKEGFQLGDSHDELSK
eukprot:TRINITY_DN63510_c0_g1_i1.p1 TRINITY_DN63510_c0_g1~~TRINITY_DN63510_c0_g1_i1.p1  ORF type:complete len:578 (+),score=102.79 TRINITY_DN63510_c0_g1_i1:72-1805(+)